MVASRCGTGLYFGVSRGSRLAGLGHVLGRALRLQVRQDVARVLIALAGILGQALQDNGAEIIRQVRALDARIGRTLGHPLVHQLHRRFAAEGHFPGEDFVQDQPQRIEVRPVVHFAGFHLLRRHVARRPHDLPGAGHLGDFGFQRFGQPKIQDEQIVGLIDQDVLRLQVAVHHLFAVRRIQGRAQLAGEFEPALERHTAGVVDQVGQILALDEGHGDVLHAAEIAQVVDAQNVLVGDAAGQQQLLLEALHGLRAGQLRAHQLERHGAVEFQVERLVDRPHAALAQQPFDAIAVGEHLAFGNVKHGPAVGPGASARGAALPGSSDAHGRRARGRASAGGVQNYRCAIVHPGRQGSPALSAILHAVGNDGTAIWAQHGCCPRYPNTFHYGVSAGRHAMGLAIHPEE